VSDDGLDGPLEEIPAALDGQRVDRVVALLTGLSRAEAAALVASGGVLVDGQPAAGKHRVAEGQVLAVVGPLPGPSRPPAPDPSVAFTVVHADEAVVVIDKPEGLVVHPGSGNDAGTLVNGLLARFPDVAGVGDPARPGVVHRLDKGTSGLLVVARSRSAYEHLVGQLSRRAVERRYLALVWGVPTPSAGRIDAPIGRSPREPTRMAVVAGGREARTSYEVRLAAHEPVEAALLACRLETGRTHQIRVHLAAIGHPVVGDAAYGGARPGLTAVRPMLHAWQLAFEHPVTGERLAFESPVPDDLQALLASLR
jgi:23S rRNA pseudouridine1911/1915/1917 synthase